MKCVVGDGDVFVWGGNSEGQLGIGSDTDQLHEPRKLNLEEKAVYISCGYYHTAIVTGISAILQKYCIQ